MILDFLTARGCETPSMFLKALSQERLELVLREWIFSGITHQFTIPRKLSHLRVKKNSSFFTNLFTQKA
jgi:hypothetical protein